MEQVGYPQNAESLVILCRHMSLSSSSWSARPASIFCFAVCASSIQFIFTKIGALQKRSKVAMSHCLITSNMGFLDADFICCAPRRKTTFWILAATSLHGLLRIIWTNSLQTESLTLAFGECTSSSWHRLKILEACLAYLVYQVKVPSATKIWAHPPWIVNFTRREPGVLAHLPTIPSIYASSNS